MFSVTHSVTTIPWHSTSIALRNAFPWRCTPHGFRDTYPWHLFHETLEMLFFRDTPKVCVCVCVINIASMQATTAIPFLATSLFVSSVFVWLMTSALRPPHSLSWPPLLSDGKWVMVCGWRCVYVTLWVTLCGWRCVTEYVTPVNYGGVLWCIRWYVTAVCYTHTLRRIYICVCACQPRPCAT